MWSSINISDHASCKSFIWSSTWNFAKLDILNSIMIELHERLLNEPNVCVPWIGYRPDLCTGFRNVSHMLVYCIIHARFAFTFHISSIYFTNSSLKLSLFYLNNFAVLYQQLSMNQSIIDLVLVHSLSVLTNLADHELKQFKELVVW